MLVAAGETILVLTILELLWLIQNQTWLETNLDFASVYAASFSEAAAAGARPTISRVCARYTRFFNAVA